MPTSAAAKKASKKKKAASRNIDKKNIDKKNVDKKNVDKKKAGKKKASAGKAVKAASTSRKKASKKKASAKVTKKVAAKVVPHQSIRIRGAKEHNLKGVNIDIPRDQMVVITGLSGSGKSSLAFDTIYAEGQRKYMESLSAYARQFLDQLKKPDIESIEGLPPTIAIEQRSSSHNPRSTVATTTEIYDYLRLLFARVGQPRCWHKDDNGKTCGHPISRQSATHIVDEILKLPEGSRVLLLAPLITGKKGHHKEVFQGMIKQGFVRARVDGEIMDLRDLKGDTPFTTKTQRYQMHTIEAVVDRLVIRQQEGEDPDELRTRISDSVELALKLSEGTLIVSVLEEETAKDVLYSEHHACPLHPDHSLTELEPRLFSFNSPYGACPVCGGLGKKQEFDPELIAPNQSLSLSEGVIEPWRKNGKRMNIYYSRLIKRFCRDFSISSATPFNQLDDDIQRILMHGTNSDDEDVYGTFFEGVIPNLQRRWESTDSEYVKARLHGYQGEKPCDACHGSRLRTEAMHVFIEVDKGEFPGGTPASDFNQAGNGDQKFYNIQDVVNLNIEQATEFFQVLKLTEETATIAEPIVKEIRARLGFMQSVGLGYLNLSRATGTLSGGEAQRIRLATQVGSGLVGCCYVLDEPTIGLHQRDNDRLITTLRHLSDIGNTVIVVEHDEDTIMAADHLIDIGPGPGVHGGTCVASGPAEEVKNHPTSLTAKYLRGDLEIQMPDKLRPLKKKKAITVKGARENNLKNIDVTVPLGGLVCVTGVSGSGKSTLINRILLQSIQKNLHGSKVIPGDHDKVLGMDGIDKLIEVDQSPIGRTPRSNPATYTGVFDHIRSIFTQTKEAKIRGYKPGRFSFNVKGGRCEDCQGQGTKKVEMHFLPDVYVECETCRGQRYNRETLDIEYRGKNISQVLNMTIEDALGFFENFPKILPLLQALNDVGLGYLELGQRATTLSGGEAQRVKLATELGKKSTGNTLYILDEPTTGLHFADIDRLLGVLQQLAGETQAGGENTILVIEHNLDIIKAADWIIDLGPEGGDHGGQIIAEGTPAQVAQIENSYTGKYLKKYFD